MPEKTLFCLLPGLGDALVASPLMRLVAETGSTIDALTMLAPVTEYAKALPVQDVIQLPLLDTGRIVASLGGIARLRRRRYDAVFVPFPATRWQYAVVAAAIGGRRTVIHRYGGVSSLISAVVNATQVELRGGHRAYENLRLLRSGSPGRTVEYWLPEAWKQRRVPGSLGIHVGTMAYKGNEARRWPLENFAAICREAAKARSVRVFFGPNEHQDYEYFERHVQASNIQLFREPLAAAAQAVSECEVFVANDSGFAHLAAGLGVKTVTLFGMTDPLRAAPLGRSLPVRTSECPPCHDEGLRDFRCVRGLDYRCIRKDLTVETVLSAIEFMFKEDDRKYEPKVSGKFQLYARPHG